MRLKCVLQLQPYFNIMIAYKTNDVLFDIESGRQLFSYRELSKLKN